jgi:xanthine phosphoribosyltransferase
MVELEEKILKEGKVLPGNILKVDCFLNHCIDVPFLMKMGKEIADLYKNVPVNKILTIETSGIPIAFAAAQYMNVPVVFAKKDKSGNISDKVFSSRVVSFTKKNVYDAVVSREYLGKGDKVLVIDDFLAKGNALTGLMDIINQAEAELVGCAIAIEKGFQGGGDELRAKGVRVDSLAIIESMTENSLTFRK